MPRLRLTRTTRLAAIGAAAVGLLAVATPFAFAEPPYSDPATRANDQASYNTSYPVSRTNCSGRFTTWVSEDASSPTGFTAKVSLTMNQPTSCGVSGLRAEIAGSADSYNTTVHERTGNGLFALTITRSVDSPENRIVIRRAYAEVCSAGSTATMVRYPRAAIMQPAAPGCRLYRFTFPYVLA